MAAARRVAQRDLRFNNVSTYALAFLAPFVFSFLFLSTSFSPVPHISRSISRSRSPPPPRFSPPKTTTVVARYREDAERKSACHLGACDAVKLLCIYYRTITNDVPLELCHSRIFCDGDADSLAEGTSLFGLIEINLSL